jgi:hypothetical protein
MSESISHAKMGSHIRISGWLPLYFVIIAIIAVILIGIWAVIDFGTYSLAVQTKDQLDDAEWRGTKHEILNKANDVPYRYRNKILLMEDLLELSQELADDASSSKQFINVGVIGLVGIMGLTFVGLSLNSEDFEENNTRKMLSRNALPTIRRKQPTSSEDKPSHPSMPILNEHKTEPVDPVQAYYNKRRTRINTN